MRSEIFTEAWRLFKMYKITFGQALSLSWMKRKMDRLSDDLNLALALDNKEVVKVKIAELKPLNEMLKSIMYNVNVRVVVKSDAPKHDYMTGKYMGD